MDIHERRSWMYDRLLPGRKGLTDSFVNGVEEFVSWACLQHQFMDGELIRCPCSKCRNTRFMNCEDVKVDLYRRGFMPNYWYWVSQGESRPSSSGTEPTFVEMPSNDHFNRFENMIYDAASPEVIFRVNEPLEEAPNAEAQKFYYMLDADQRPLYPGCEEHTEFSTVVRLLTIKSEGNISQRSFNETVALMKETHPSGNLIPKDFYSARKLISKLGLNAERIDCCVNGCMLFRDNETLHCSFCGEARYLVKTNGRGRTKQIPVKRLIYLPLIPRLKRLYASMSSASHMTWHYENRREPGVLCHPSDGEAWKKFDETYQ